MSLADKLAAVPAEGERPRRGPEGECARVYGPGTLDDWEAVEARRLSTSWPEAQKALDKVLGIAEPIHGDKFRYHWRRKCYCWPRDLRR